MAKTCPNCGAELHNIQGYNFVCEYCGTITQVDPQTRAMINAQIQRQRQQELMARQIEYQNNVEKSARKGWIIAAIIIFAIPLLFRIIIVVLELIF